MKKNPFGPEARALRRLERRTRIADAFSTSPFKQDESYVERKDMPAAALRLAQDFLAQYQWPVLPMLSYRGTRVGTRDEQTPVEDTDAQIILSASVITASGVRKDMEIPIQVHNRKLLEPSVVILDGQPRILAQSLIDELVRTGTFKKKVDPRGHIFGPPLDREARDIYLETDEDLRTEEKFSRGMYSVATKKEAVTPRVDQVLEEVQTLVEEGYEDIDVLLAVHKKYPTIADAVINSAIEKGLLKDVG